MSTKRRTAALVWGPWRVEQVDLGSGVRLCVRHDRYLVGYCKTAQEALDLLEWFGVPVDQLTREDGG